MTKEERDKRLDDLWERKAELEKKDRWNHDDERELDKIMRELNALVWED